MMILQLQEPEYYTLAEVAERWGRSEDVLLRLGREGKLSLGTLVAKEYPIMGKVCAPTTGLLGAMMLGADPGRYVGCYPIAPEDLKGRARLLLFDPSINRVSSLGDRILLHPQSLQEGIGTRWYPWPPMSLPGEYFILADRPFPIGDIIIPASEIHRIEHQREAAQKAADDDILGNRERETMQAVIAAMTQVIASTALKYKRNGRPNVDAISGALEEVIPDRTKRGISETISRALKAGLIRT